MKNVLLKYANDILFLFDCDFNFIEINDKAIKTYGYSHKEFLKMKFHDLIDHNKCPQFNEICKKIDSYHGYIYETVHQRKDGSTFPVEISSRPIIAGRKKYYHSIIRDITVRKQVEDQLRQANLDLNTKIKELLHSEEKFNKAFHASPVIMSISTLKDGRYMEINDSFVRLHGYSREEIIGRTALEIGAWNDPCDRDIVAQLLNEQGYVKNLEVNYFTKARELHTGLLSIELINFGGEQCLIAIMHDITDLKRTEKQLQQSKQELTTLLENIPDIISRFDRNLRYLYVNPAVTQATGLHQNCFIGKTNRDLDMPEEQVHIWNRALEKVFMTGKNHIIEFCYQLADKQKHFESRLIPENSPQGEVESVLVICRNITMRKEMEHRLTTYQEQLENMVYERTLALKKSNEQLKQEIIERLQAETALQQSERKYRALFNNTNDAILLHGISGNNSFESIIEVNDAVCRRLGYTREELTQLSLADIYAPESRRLLPNILNIILNRKHLTFEVIHITKTGQKIPVEAASHLFTLNGKKVILSVIRDITERKRAEAELQEARQQAERLQTMASLATMTAGIAHEINQPLNSLKIMVDGLLFWHDRNGTLDENELIDGLKNISAQADRISLIIRRMKALVRHESPPNLYPCNLNSAVEKAIVTMHAQLLASNIKLRSILQNPLPPLSGENFGLEEVIVILLVNAIQALNNSRQIDKEILITTRSERYIILEISDNGSGVPTDLQEKIFEPFFTTKEVGQGMGLGLSIAHTIITSFHGQISLRTNEKGGTTFQLDFPVYNNDLIEEVGL
jgi:PAS domain S-box-containing protein